MLGLWSRLQAPEQQIVSHPLLGMSRIQGTDLTSVAAPEEGEYTDVMNKEMRKECDNNGYCDEVNTFMISCMDAW